MCSCGCQGLRFRIGIGGAGSHHDEITPGTPVAPSAASMTDLGSGWPSSAAMTRPGDPCMGARGGGKGRAKRPQ